MSELEQLRDENRRLQQDRDAAIRQLADEGRARGAVEAERDRLRNGCRCVANAMRDWSARHGYQAKIDALATDLQALAQPAPAPAEGQQPEPASDGEDRLLDYPEAARVIALWLEDFCDERKPYADMIADAARRAGEEIERLRAIVAKLPKTADGVPVVPGMKVWVRHRDVFYGLEVRDWGNWRGVCSLRIGMATYNLTPDETYSTREAALAASEGEVQHG